MAPPPEYSTRNQESSAQGDDVGQSQSPSSQQAQESGQSNASNVATAGLGADTCEQEPYQQLQEAVSSGNAVGAWDAFGQLTGTDHGVLKDDTSLCDSFLTLIGPSQAATALFQLQYPASEWLVMGDLYCAGDAEALRHVLDDVAVTNAAELEAIASELLVLTSYLTPDVVGPLLELSTGLEQATLISTEQGCSLYTSCYTDSPLVVLSAMASECQIVLDVYASSTFANGLLSSDTMMLNDHILNVWVAPGEWFRALAESHSPDLMFLMEENPPGWGAALPEALVAGDAAWLTPTSDLFGITIGSIGLVDPLQVAIVCDRLELDRVSCLEASIDGGWLSLECAQGLLIGATLEDQLLVANNDLLIEALSPLAWTGDLLDMLVMNGAELSLICIQSPAMQQWLLSDTDQFVSLVSLEPFHWVDALILTEQVAIVLECAIADPALWSSALDDSMFMAVLSKLQKPCGDVEADGLWALWTDAGRSVEVGLEMYYTLYGSRLWAGSDNPQYVLPAAPVTQSDGQTGTADIRLTIAVVPPTADTLNTYLTELIPIPRGQIATTATVFGNTMVEEFRLIQIGGTAINDADFGDSWSANTQTQTTSLFFDAPGNLILLNVDSSGNIPSGLSGPQNSVYNIEHDVQEDTGVGATTATADAAKTYFQNHSQHEAGHGVGARTFDGMTESGDTAAKNFMDWKGSSKNDMLSNYFSATGNVEVGVDDTDATTTIPAADLGAWMMTWVDTGQEAAAAAQGDGAGGYVTRMIHPTGSSRDRLWAIQDAVDTDLADYLDTINFNQNVWQFPGFTPSGDRVFMKMTEGATGPGIPMGYVSYKKSVMDAMRSSHGWYSLKTPQEDFAEIYTKYYSTATGATPSAGNWDTFFRDLEASPESQLQAGVPPQMTGVGGAPAPGTTAAPATGAGSGSGSPGVTTSQGSSSTPHGRPL